MVISGLHQVITLSKYLFTVFPGSSAVEQATVNRLAGGSNPSRGAILTSAFAGVFLWQIICCKLTAYVVSSVI